VVIVQAEDHVAAVAADMDVFRAWREPERVKRQMGLNEAAMRLPLDGGQLHLLRRHAEIEPGRELGDRNVLGAIEHELGHDLLRPGGARLGVGADDDVVVAELEVVPDGRVEMVIVQLALLLRPMDRGVRYGRIRARFKAFT
jgi:hypothetical protein